MRKDADQRVVPHVGSFRDRDATSHVGLYEADHDDARSVSVVARTGHASGCRGAHCATCLACLVQIEYRLFVGSYPDRVFCRNCLYQVSIHL